MFAITNHLHCNVVVMYCFEDFYLKVNDYIRKLIENNTASCITKPSTNKFDFKHQTVYHNHEKVESGVSIVALCIHASLEP